MMATTAAEKWLRGPVGFAAISIMHILIIYLLATALKRAGVIDSPPPRIQVISEITEIPRVWTPPIGPRPDSPFNLKTEPPPPIPNDVDDAPPTVDPIDDSSLSSLLTGNRVVDSPIVGPRADPRFPLTQPDYPSSEIRKGNEGRVLIRLRVGRQGQVLAAEIVKSSGFPALDHAALQTALREWRFLPARQGEVAIAGEFQTWVRFSLTDR